MSAKTTPKSAPAAAPPDPRRIPPAVPDAGPAEVPALVPLADLADSPFQPRTEYPAAELADLTASVKRHGVLQPPVVRPVNGHWDAVAGGWDCDRFEIVVGHKRVRAARAAGLVEITVLVRPLDDRTVQILQDVENAKRADISPADRAAAFVRLRDGGMTLDAIAAETATSVSQVRDLLLLDRMPAPLAKALAAGHVTPSAAAAVCRIPDEAARDEAAWCVLLGQNNPDRLPKPKEREKAFAKGVADRAAGKASHWQFEPHGKDEARQVVEEHYQRQLKGAPFPQKGPIALALVPNRPACDTCPDRAGNRAQVDESYKATRADTCLDVSCYRAKLAAWGEREIARLADEGRTVVTAKEAAALYPADRPYQTEPEGWADIDARPSYGLIPWNDEKNVNRDKTVAGNWEKKLGDEFAKALTYVVHPRESTVKRLIRPDVLKKLLKAAGVITVKPKDKAAGKGRSAVGLAVASAADIQGRYVVEVAKRTYAALKNGTDSEGKILGHSDRIVAHALLGFFDSSADRSAEVIAAIVGENDPADWLDAASIAEVRAFSAALAAAQVAIDSQFAYVPAGSTAAFKGLLGVSPADFRKAIQNDLDAEVKAAKSTGKPAGKSAKPARKGAAA